MKSISVLGIDLAKNVFHIHGSDEAGRTVISKELSRRKLVEYVANLAPCIIGMEACGGSHFWGRKFREMGHEVRLVAPQYVKAFVRGNKTDKRDAQAIAECVSRPEMKLVAIKTVRQQEIAAIHRVRERLVRSRTALSNEMRGLLQEFGYIVGMGMKRLGDALLGYASDAESSFSNDFRELLIASRTELIGLNQKIKEHEDKLKIICKEMEVCQRLLTVPGVGPMTSTAIVAHIGDARAFKNGREMAAYLGLVPKQHSSGGKTVMLGISKRGNRTIRKFLIHGARAVIQFSERKTDRVSQWVRSVDSRRGRNKACVALANKNARIIWALMVRGESYLARAE